MKLSRIAALLLAVASVALVCAEESAPSPSLVPALPIPEVSPGVVAPASLSVGGGVLQMPRADVLFVGQAGPDNLPIMVIYADGRIETSPQSVPDEGAAKMLESLRVLMSTAYHDLKEVDAALEVLDRLDADGADKAKARARIESIRKAWAPKFRAPTPPVAPTPASRP